MEQKEEFITEKLFPSFDAEIRYIEKNGVDEKIIRRILDKQRPKKEHMKDLYNRYKICENGVPIFTRSFTDENAINNKVNNDYFGEIINTTVGYMATNFSYAYSQDAENFETNKEVLEKFCVRNKISNIDMEIIKFSQICGYVGRMMYINLDGEESIRAVEPFNCTFLSKTEIFEPEFSIYDIDTEEIDENFEIQKCKKIEFYDSQNIYYFKTGKDGDIIEDTDDKGRHMAPHLFDYNPFQGIPNNVELMGCGEKILAQIDAIDRTLSDCNSEVEAFKLAYMIITGARIDEEELEKAKRTGAFNIPGRSNGEVNINYLVKAINDTFVENHLNRLDKGIYKFSQTPDLNDEAFNGTTSGIAMKFKLFPLETRCSMLERKLDAANMYMFKVLSTSWKKKAIDFDPLEVTIEYKRNIPLDLEYYASTLSQLKGNVSDQTALNLMPFIENADYELDLMKSEADTNIEPLDFNSETDGNNEETTGLGAMPQTNLL